MSYREFCGCFLSSRVVLYKQKREREEPKTKGKVFYELLIPSGQNFQLELGKINNKNI